jgi:hypothetical protein
MWERTTGTIGTILPNPPPTDVNNTYTWSSNSPTSSAADGTAFTVFLASLNNGEAPSNNGSPGSISGCFANHCDWRLPSIKELQEIVDTSATGCLAPPFTGPCIDPIFGPTQSYFYWSATTNADYLFGAWVVDFYNSFVESFYKPSNYFYVRAVRSMLW